MWQARKGQDWRGKVSLGRVRQVWPGADGLGMEGLVEAGAERRVGDRNGTTGHGMAWQAMHGRSGKGLARQDGLGGNGPVCSG